MTLFALFAQIQIGSKVTAQFFYRLAIFCASHRSFVIVLSISIFLPLCYPAFDADYLNPVRDASNMPFFWEVSSSRSQVSRKTFVEKYGIQPSFCVEQIIIKVANSKEYNKSSSVGVLEKDLLLWTLYLQERIMNTVVTYSNPSSLAAKEYTLSDLCLKPLNSMEDCNESQIMAIWEAIWEQIINDTDTNCRLGDDCIINVNMNYQGELEHLSFNALLMLAYLIFPLCILSAARLDSFRSKFGLIFSAVAHIFASLIMSLSICSLLGITLTFASVSWKLLPFILILIGVENTLILTNAVTAIPMQLNVEERVAKDRDVFPPSKTANYGRRIGVSLVVNYVVPFTTKALIFLIATTNVHHTNIEFPYLKSALSSLIGNSIDFPATHTNITFWETPMDQTASEFWSMVNPDKKYQFVEILPTRLLTLSYDIEQDDIYHQFVDVNWRLSIRTYIKTFIWSLKFIIFLAIVIVFTIPIPMGFSSLENLVIRVTRFFEKTNSDRNKDTPSSESSSLYNTTPQIIILRGRHSADVDCLCANSSGIIITSATDRNIISWSGMKGTPLRKLERYVSRCSTCKCDSTGELKRWISWTVRTMCMSENIAAAGFEDGVVRVWDVNSGQVIYILKDTVEDIEQIFNDDKTIIERVTCLQIIPSPLHSYDYKSKKLSDQKVPAMLLATYQNGYFREWNLVSGQISHIVFTNQKGGISFLFIVEDQDGMRIFTGARDGSVKCWVRTVDFDNNTDSSCNELRNSVWKLLYTLPGEFGNAITSVSAKVIKTKKDCFGVVVTGAADGEVRVYDYFTGQSIETLSYGISGKQKLVKEREKQQKKSKDFSSGQDWFEEYEDEYEFWDETEDFDSHQDAIINIIIHPLKEESCPCGDVETAGGFLIITSSLDEK
ncbi:15259_t:CDS:2, partial [Gigaspora margarita]